MLWIDLKKVTRDSVSVTSIQNAEYELEWVQKSNDAKKDFVMLPFRYFESDTAFISDKLLRDAFHSFKTDSRALYAKHNVNVTERTATFFSDSLSYSICLGSFSEENSVEIIENELLLTYTIFRIPHGNRQFLWYAGKFADRPAAVRALVEIQSKTPFKNIHVAKRIEADPPNQTTSGN
jgi:hypothetical protein